MAAPQPSGNARLFEHEPGWIDFAAVRASYTDPNRNMVHFAIPALGNLTVLYMPHGDWPAPSWVQDGGKWVCCRNATLVRMGHGHAWQGWVENHWESDGSSIELAVSAAGISGVVGLPDVHPDGMPAGTYLLRFRLTADGALRQTLLIEKVNCYQSESSYDWIYGCGRDPVACDGAVAPMGKTPGC